MTLIVAAASEYFEYRVDTIDALTVAWKFGRSLFAPWIIAQFNGESRYLILKARRRSECAEGSIVDVAQEFLQASRLTRERKREKKSHKSRRAYDSSVFGVT